MEYSRFDFGLIPGMGSENVATINESAVFSSTSMNFSPISIALLDTRS